jgi:hypothetical protein
MQPRGFTKKNADYAREVITTLPGLVAASEQMNPRDMNGRARALWEEACPKLGEVNRLFAELFNALEGPLEISVPPSGNSQDTKAAQNLTGIREWAREQGYEVGDRGRMPKEIIAAYERRTDADANLPQAGEVRLP